MVTRYAMWIHFFITGNYQFVFVIFLRSPQPPQIENDLASLTDWFPTNISISTSVFHSSVLMRFFYHQGIVLRGHRLTEHNILWFFQAEPGMFWVYLSRQYKTNLCYLVSSYLGYICHVNTLFYYRKLSLYSSFSSVRLNRHIQFQSRHLSFTVRCLWGFFITRVLSCEGTGWLNIMFCGFSRQSLVCFEFIWADNIKQICVI